MNKLHIFGMMALAVVGLTSCEADDDPKLQEPTEFVLNTPPFANQLYELSEDGILEVTCSQPNYGLTLATTYGVEISMLEDFGESLPAPDENDENAIPYSVMITPPNPQSAVLQLTESSIAEAICAMRGIKTEEEYTEIPAHPLYIRAHAHINNQPSTKITSNTVKLDQVKGYCAFKAEEFDVIWCPGNATGWDFGRTQQLEAYETGKYRGFLYLNNEFKFTSKAGWDGDGNWGAGSAPGTLANGSNDNVKVPAETGNGLYYVEVDVEALTYTLLFIDNVGLVGTLNGWDVAAPIEMSTEDYIVYTVEADFPADEGFKFVFNGPTSQWKYNLGGSLDRLTFDGDNLPSTAGTHKVTLDFSKIPYTATFE